MRVRRSRSCRYRRSYRGASANLATPGEVLVSQTVRDLVAGSGLAFEDRGSSGVYSGLMCTDYLSRLCRMGQKRHLRSPVDTSGLSQQADDFGRRAVLRIWGQNRTRTVLAQQEARGF
jgi:hypothetical protein